MAAVIDALLPLSNTERGAFVKRLSPPIVTRFGVTVGRVRPVAGLVESLREGKTVSG
jgi:hypothetical protein